MIRLAKNMWEYTYIHMLADLFSNQKSLNTIKQQKF